MTGQTFGYVRVSTLDQNTIRQLDGEQLDRVFTDQSSGKDQNRPQLDALIDFARDGDTVLCIQWIGWPGISTTSAPSSGDSTTRR